MGEKRILLTFEGNSITTDGSDGIIDIVLGLQRRVDVHHFKVHRHTAEPTAQTHNPDAQPTPSCSAANILKRCSLILTNLKTSLT